MKILGNRPTIQEIEKNIQQRSNKKDPSMRIVGLEKDFLFREQGFNVFSIDPEWIRNNLDVNMGSGGHGRVHSFIPLMEIWVLTEGEKEDYVAKTIIHEIEECKKMKDMNYTCAHKQATDKETEDTELIEKLKLKLRKAKSNNIINKINKKNQLIKEKMTKIMKNRLLEV